ncbi:hypothetical protein AW736_24890 [Termitidicoccus mucosus]|uniref:LamG-like jellyroll fold domain-containing protein n=2 Tax=Termitidicoccus mucosus TaxID=1184151 RepID=A0A178IDH4_9BACT|nr:hypothetical protein AW736_24890 [Opitutaceae bacterium TSB47]
MNRPLSHPAKIAAAALIVFFFLIHTAHAGGDPRHDAAPMMWKIDSLESIGGLPVEVTGSPSAVETPSGRAVRFDGTGDGLMLPAAPIAGWEKFTVEIIFKPDGDGPREQRFLHMEKDGGGPRMLVELRMDAEGAWCLDSYLMKDQKNRLALIDTAKRHPGGRWHHTATVYDGSTLRHYVDGELQGAGKVDFGTLPVPGRTSIGVRQNKISWFKGLIREIRFHPTVRTPAEIAADAKSVGSYGTEKTKEGKECR